MEVKLRVAIVSQSYERGKSVLEKDIIPTDQSSLVRKYGSEGYLMDDGTLYVIVSKDRYSPANMCGRRFHQLIFIDEIVKDEFYHMIIPFIVQCGDFSICNRNRENKTVYIPDEFKIQVF